MEPSDDHPGKDAQLVRRTLAGDRQAFGELVTCYQGNVYGLAYSFVGNWANAQDIAQEAFIRAYCNLDQLKQEERFAAWLRRVAFSVTMNWLKAFRPTVFDQLDGHVDLDSLDIPDFAPGPREALEKQELAEAVLNAVGSLPPKYRVPLTMFHLDGLSYRKVAEFLDIPLGTAQSLIHRARKKLNESLAAYAVKEVTPMVKEVLREHKLPEEFAQKVLDGVPALAWGSGRDCTFIGALEAALAVTEHPFSYADLMGYSGVAFRIRWSNDRTTTEWCGSTVIGEMPEEIDAITAATGWSFVIGDHWEEDSDVAQEIPRIVASLDADRPVVTYASNMDMAVLYGYEDSGKTWLVKDYNEAEVPFRLDAAKLGPMQIYLGEHSEPVAQREALMRSLRTAVSNWGRGAGDGGIQGRQYFYGADAFEAWTTDLMRAEELSAEHIEGLQFLNGFVYTSLKDARKAAVVFLKDNAKLVKADAHESLERAADIYAQEVALLEASQRDLSFDDWRPESQSRTRSVLLDACSMEAQAITAIVEALAALTVASG